MSERSFPWRSLLGGAFLATQLALVLLAPAVAPSLPRWAPNDTLVDYRISVRAGSRELSPAEVSERYALPATGSFELPKAALLELVRHREEQLGPTPARTVDVVCSVNGRPEVHWSQNAP
jgi:hypothetical protein